MPSETAYCYPRFTIVRQVFKQLVSAVHWLHTKAKVVHLDLSLENTMVRRFNRHGIPEIALVDFGVSVDFSEETKTVDEKGVFWHDRAVGKLPYMSREVLCCNKLNPFNAQAADVWSLGIILYILLFGAYPWDKADFDNPVYSCIFKGDFKKMLAANSLSHWLTKECYDAMQRILCVENKRIRVGQLKKHPFCKFPDERMDESLSSLSVFSAAAVEE